MPGKPKSKDIKNIEGNPGNRKPPKILPGNGFPACPNKLFLDKNGNPDKPARECWRRLKREFEREPDLISGVDYYILVMFCEAWARFCLASEDIKQNGFTISGQRGDIKNPALQALTSAESAMLKICNELGMTPAARQRLFIDLDSEPGKKKNKDSFKGFDY